MFNIILVKRALKDLYKINSDHVEFIKSKLIEYSRNPFNHARKLSNSKIGTYKFRIGDYRVIFDIDENKILVLRIGHRKDVYK